MKLLIGVPTLDYMHADFVRCLTGLLRAIEGIDYDLQIQMGTLVYMAREQIALKAMHEEYTHVLWLDADMVFAPTILTDLMKHDKPFVTGIYQSRKDCFASNIFKTVIPGVQIERFEEYPDKPFRIAACGFGCALTSVGLLQDMHNEYKTFFTPRKDLGEDFAFCLRATDMGVPLWCDPDVVCGHIGHITIYPEAHRIWKKVHGLDP